MLSPLNIFSLDQGTLYGKKPDLEEFERRLGLTERAGPDVPLSRAWRVFRALCVGIPEESSLSGDGLPGAKAEQIPIERCGDATLLRARQANHSLP